MKLAIFGASGGTGHCLVEQALAAGSSVTTLVRRPETFTLQHERLHVITGNILDPAQVEATINGQDAVLSALGTNQRGIVTLCTDGIRNILNAMEKHGVKRLSAVSAYGAADSHHRNLYNFMLWLSLKEKMIDKEHMEELIKNSHIDWTLARPSFLTDGPCTGQYRYDRYLQMNIFSRISRANLADFMLRHLTDTTTFQQTISITG